MLCSRNNTDGNKLMIFSGVALYYGDTYILLHYILYYISGMISMANNVTESYRELLKESLVSSFQQINFRVVELWKPHAILLAVRLPHEPAPARVSRET